MNVMNIDLHTHSCYSDGVHSPAELVLMAKRLNVNVLAIADHDSVAGIPDAISAAQEAGLDIIPAVELSVQFGQFEDVHLLGYGIDFSDLLFLSRITEFRTRRERRNYEILELVNAKLRSEGRSQISIDEVLVFSRDAVGRPHIARALLERRYVATVEEAFQRYLIPCNVPKSFWQLDVAINEIHRIGGVAVLAHPTSISKNLQELERIITSLKSLGLDGIEVFNNMGWPQEIEFLRRLAIEQHLIITAGSDFHGIEEGIEIGKGREGMRFDSGLIAPLIAGIHNQRSKVTKSG